MGEETQYLKTMFLLQFLLIVIVYTRAYPISPDERLSLFRSKWYKKPDFKIALTPESFTDMEKHRFGCGDRCNTNVDSFVPYPTKKDVFVSRSWSAGGMPFSVLYMKPKHLKNTRSSKQLPLSENIDSIEGQQKTVVNYDEDYQVPEKIEAQAQTQAMMPGSNAGLLASRRQYSIIPQLFVSYGWGPLGK